MLVHADDADFDIVHKSKNQGLPRGEDFSVHNILSNKGPAGKRLDDLHGGLEKPFVIRPIGACAESGIGAVGIGARFILSECATADECETNHDRDPITKKTPDADFDNRRSSLNTILENRRHFITIEEKEGRAL